MLALRLRRPQMVRSLLALALLTVSAAFSSTTFAQSIGINFVGGQHTGGPDGASLLPADVAGVIPQANWTTSGPTRIR